MQDNLIKRTQVESLPAGDKSDYTSLNNGVAQHNKMKHTKTIQDILMTLVKYIKHNFITKHLTLHLSPKLGKKSTGGCTHKSNFNVNWVF